MTSISVYWNQVNLWGIIRGIAGSIVYVPQHVQKYLNKLTDRQCKAAKPRDKTYKLSDGGGLYLEVSQTGSKYWRMKYRRPSDKKEDRLAFGVYPTISLQDAREKRDNAKVVSQGDRSQSRAKSSKSRRKRRIHFWDNRTSMGWKPPDVERRPPKTRT